ncbi:MAG: ergothioneine biosynthesis protein EgtB [Terriglobales bacterium]
MATRGIETGKSAPALAHKYSEVRATTLRLTAPLSAEDQMLQSMPDASPVKWHLAHTTWFFETFLLTPHADNYQPCDPRFRQLFNSYYKQVGEHPLRGARGLMSRPSLDEVHAYRHSVDAAMLELIDEADDDVLALIELGLNHEQQHQELILTDVKHALWCSPLRPSYLPRPIIPPGAAGELNWQTFEGGVHEIGHTGGGFAFDNEGPRHQVLLRPFRLASRAVTSGEWLQFMADDGYRRPELWLSDGWDTVCAQQWDAPLYWERHDGSCWQYTMSGPRAVDASEPVCHVSYYEADAFARWAGARLPSEAEWEIAAARSPSWGTMLEDETFHPQAAQDGNALNDERAPALQQIFGDIWEWTASPYVAYPGFRPAAGALGEYNGKFMCNQFVLRGGSCATPTSHIRVTYRNFFPPQARWQFSGVRLASDQD